MTKKMATLLMLVIVCAAPLSAYRQSTQLVEWLLTLNSGGTPWDKKFKVQLNQEGMLSVVEEDPNKIPNDPVTKLSAKLPNKDLQEIYDYALAVLTEPVRNLPNDKIYDGTVIKLELVTLRRSLARSYHLGVVEEEAPALAKLLELINKHVPKDHQIF